MRAPLPSRRNALALLVTTGLATTLGRALGGPLDQGIGGTGAAPPTDESDRGIGGTGVIGTIRKFGSIFVNDLRIAYPADAVVRIDEQPASIRDLRIGQVVRVAASGSAQALSTQAIDVTSEVVGPIEHVRGRRMTILGQTVLASGANVRGRRAGEVVAVSGLRRNDGTIVASLVELRPGAPSRIAGPVVVANDGALKIGGVALTGVAPDLIGRRAIVVGALQGDRFAVAHATAESALLSDVRTLSIESYVERRGDALVLGSGFQVANTGALVIPAGQSVRAVLNTTVDADGRLHVESFRAGDRGVNQPTTSEPRGDNDRGRAGEGNANRIPMNFGNPSVGNPNGTGGPGPIGGPGGGFGTLGGPTGGGVGGQMPGNGGGGMGGFGGGRH